MMKSTVAALICLAGSAHGLTLDLPGRPQQKFEDVTAIGALHIPTAAWDGTTVPGQTISGEVSTRVYHAAITTTPAAMLVSLSQQLTDAGYSVELACVARSCGGFDFRFALPIVDPPKMFVDLGNYAFISARKSNSEGIIVVASQTAANANVQVTEVYPPGSIKSNVANAAPLATQAKTGDLPSSLEADGFFILSDLRFKVGASALDGDDFQSLVDLADYLSANPQRTVALVGHTDATGSLDGNIALSKKRAGAVRSLLIDRHDVDPKRVAAEGMGYLAPVAPNTTDVGREQNRRVEVIITSNE
ncbi:MAG: OmpA family protein [Planktomarina sp.]